GTRTVIPTAAARAALGARAAGSRPPARHVDATTPLTLASRRGARCFGATTRAWSPRTLRQPTRLAGRSRGSRSSSWAIARRLEGLIRVDSAHLARLARPRGSDAAVPHSRLQTRVAGTPLPLRAPPLGWLADDANGHRQLVRPRWGVRLVA